MRPSGLDPALLDDDAVRAVSRLQERGHEAYLVGGCVRDLLLHRQPKDFDIATGARPTQVKRTFPRNCRIIGRRFKLAHLHFRHNQKILEVATFRTSPAAEGEDGDDLLITRDNEFGTAEEDALRRDFTVNALFFDPVHDSIIDYVGGIADVQSRVLRTIGDPTVRFREDPVRIIRAAKFAGRLGLRIDGPSYQAMADVAPDLARSAPPRLLEEILRLLRGGHALASFQLLRDIEALRVVLPVVSDFLAGADRSDRVRFWRTLEALDQRVLWGDEIPNAVLLGALFAAPVRAESGREERRSATTVAENLLGPFAQELRLPRRDAGGLKRICGVQQRFTARGPKRFKTRSFLRDPYFQEALMLFELQCAATGEDAADLERWQGLHDEFGGVEPSPEAEPAVADSDDGDAPRRAAGRGRSRPAGSESRTSRRSKGGEKRGDKRGGEKRGDKRGGEKRGGDKRDKAGRRGQKAEAAEKDRKKSRKNRSKSRRDNTVETLEPEGVDLSAFDVELDPRRVASFGAIVEGQGGGDKKRRKVPQSPPDRDVDYKPPPPPQSDPDLPPPPPPRDDFGDW